MSKHHDKDVDELEIDSIGVGNFMPNHAERLSIKHQMDAIKPHCDVLQTMYQYHSLNGVPSQRMKQEITSLRDHLAKLLHDMNIGIDANGDDEDEDDNDDNNDETEKNKYYEDQETKAVGFNDDDDEEEEEVSYDDSSESNNE